MARILSQIVQLQTNPRSSICSEISSSFNCSDISLSNHYHQIIVQFNGEWYWRRVQMLFLNYVGKLDISPVHESHVAWKIFNLLKCFSFGSRRDWTFCFCLLPTILAKLENQLTTSPQVVEFGVYDTYLRMKLLHQRLTPHQSPLNPLWCSDMFKIAALSQIAAKLENSMGC